MLLLTRRSSREGMQLEPKLRTGRVLMQGPHLKGKTQRPVWLSCLACTTCLRPLAASHTRTVSSNEVLATRRDPARTHTPSTGRQPFRGSAASSAPFRDLNAVAEYPPT